MIKINKIRKRKIKHVGNESHTDLTSIQCIGTIGLALYQPLGIKWGEGMTKTEIALRKINPSLSRSPPPSCLHSCSLCLSIFPNLLIPSRGRVIGLKDGPKTQVISDRRNYRKNISFTDLEPEKLWVCICCDHKDRSFLSMKPAQRMRRKINKTKMKCPE